MLKVKGEFLLKLTLLLVGEKRFLFKYYLLISQNSSLSNITKVIKIIGSCLKISMII